MACDISCTPNWSCATLKVDARAAINLNIHCDGENSCSNMEVIGPDSNTANVTVNCNNLRSCSAAKFDISSIHDANINCIDEAACYYTDFSLQNTQTVTAICNNIGDPAATSTTKAACRFTDFFADGTDSFTTECYQRDCANTKFYVRNSHDVSISMLGGYAGDGTIVYGNGSLGTMNIYCNARMACYRVAIRPEIMLGDLNVYCFGSENSMCNGVEVYGDSMLGNLYFECNSSVPQGCAGAEIYCPHNYEGNCSVYCSGREGNECQNVKILTIGEYYVNNGYFDLICEGQSSCYYMDIQCSYNPSNLIDPDNLHTKPVYNYYNNIWGCDEYECGCPWVKTYNNNDFCGNFEGMDCDINCANITSGGCENVIVNASLSTNLFINCQSSNTYYHNGCEAATIICPQYMDNAQCIITCPDEGCQGVSIIGPNGMNNLFEMNCNDKACQRTDVQIIEQSNANSLDFNLNCDKPDSCRYMNFNISNVNNANVSCTAQYSCWLSNIFFTFGPNKMDLNCGSLYDNNTAEWYMECREMIVHADAVAVDTIWNHNCFNKDSCWAMEVDITSIDAGNSIMDLSLNCPSESSCYNMKYSAPNGNSISLKCLNKYSCSHNGYQGWDFSNYDMVDITCNSSNITDDREGACGVKLVLNNAGNINIYCHDYDCSDMSVIMSNSGIINIDCDGYESCFSSFFSAVDSQLLDINCNGERACRATQISCPYFQKHLCHISCSNDYYTCAWIDILVDDDFFYNYLDLQCGNNSYSCQGIEFKSNGIKTLTTYLYNITSQGWYCDSDECCPWKQEINVCNIGEVCIIYCNDNGGINCRDKVIDARNAGSLDVYCDNCEISAILCPLNIGPCNIYCNKCTNTNLWQLDNNNISVICNSSDSCIDTIINANNANHIYFESIAAYTNAKIYGNNAQSMTIKCNGNHLLDVGGCGFMNVYGTNINNFVNVYCGEPNGCVSSNFYFELANNIDIFAFGKNSLYYSNIYASNSSYFSVSCSYEPNYSYSGCYWAYLYFPKTNGYLKCYGRGCDKIVIEAFEHMNDITFEMNGCNECISVDDCIYNGWEIRCPYDTYSDTTTFGGNCGNPSICDCNYIMNTLTDSFYSLHNEYCYSIPVTTQEPITTTETTLIESTTTTNYNTETGLISTTILDTISCELDDDLNRNDCNDDGCVTGPKLNLLLKFYVCNMGPFQGNRNGLFDKIADCICDAILEHSGVNFDHSGDLSNRRMLLKRGHNNCHLRVINYAMRYYTEVATMRECNGNAYKFEFDIQDCGNCDMLNNMYNGLNSYDTSEKAMDEILTCMNQVAKQEANNDIGFQEIKNEMLAYSMNDDNEECTFDDKSGVKRNNKNYLVCVIFMVMLINLFVSV
eukprot:96049_1